MHEVALNSNLSLYPPLLGAIQAVSCNVRGGLRNKLGIRGGCTVPRHLTWIRSLAGNILQAGAYLAVISTAFGIVYGVVAFERERGDRERERISRAWSLISDVKIQDQGNLGLSEALEALNGRSIDLSRVRLSKTYLSKVNLAHALLDGANLSDAWLEQSKLCGAHLAQSDLSRANLRAADMRGSELPGASLIGANLRNANLAPLARTDGPRGEPLPANLRGANLENADLGGANLSRADLRAARLVGANLFRANLRSAHLELADLRRANFGATDLSEADLGGAILLNTSLRGARLSRANLAAAQVEGAKLDRADLSGALNVPADIDLRGACFDSATKFDSKPPVSSPEVELRWCGPPAITLSQVNSRLQLAQIDNEGGKPCVR